MTLIILTLHVNSEAKKGRFPSWEESSVACKELSRTGKLREGTLQDRSDGSELRDVLPQLATLLTRKSGVGPAETGSVVRGRSGISVVSTLAMALTTRGWS